MSEKSLSGRRRSSSVKEREKEKERERGVRGILDRIEVAAGRSTGVSVAIGGSGARRSYALAPCHHLFVSLISYFIFHIYLSLTYVSSIRSIRLV